MISMDAYKDDEGRIDWTAYNKAQADVGEICRLCSSYIISLDFMGRRRPPGPQLCGGCESLGKEKAEVEHSTMVRCPHCGNTENAYECEISCDNEAETPLDCPVCDKEFTVVTNVTYSYTSPPLVTNDEPEDNEEE